ncbi:hypothetical protein [Sphaerimonospora thailandensis]|nr:hypothetical protein [Sphaerimonospora thailandensis]
MGEIHASHLSRQLGAAQPQARFGSAPALFIHQVPSRCTQAKTRL